jgi:hypothetical protein
MTNGHTGKPKMIVKKKSPAPKTSDHAAEPELVMRPLRINFSVSPPRIVAAIERAFDRLDEVRDPRIKGVPLDLVRQVKVAKIDPAPDAVLIQAPCRRYKTLAVKWSPDGRPRQARWLSVARIFEDVTGEYPRDPERAETELSIEELAAIGFHHENVFSSLTEAAQQWPECKLENAEKVKISPVTVEAAKVMARSQTSYALWASHQGAWWPVCLCRPPVGLPPPEVSTRRHAVVPIV